MSVMVVDLQVYSCIANKLFFASFYNVVNLDHISCCCNLSEDVIKNHIKNWIVLNEQSYNLRYKSGKATNLQNVINWEYRKPVNTYQLLKWLQCIDYNIEVEYNDMSFFQQQSYNFLKQCIKDIIMVVIDNIPEYKVTNWSEY